MPIETGMYAPQRQVNPLETLGQVSTIQNQIQQNKLLGQQYIRGGVDIDTAKVGLQKAEQDLSRGQMNDLHNAYGVFVQGREGPVAYKDLVDLAGSYRRQGRISEEQYRRAVKDIPTSGDLRGFALDRYNSALPAEIITSTREVGVDPNTGQVRKGTGGQFLKEAGGGGATAETGSGKTGRVITTLPVGGAAAMERSANAWAALRDDVGSPNGSAARVFQLGKALSGLKGANTGPGTAWQNEVMSFVQSLVGTNIVPGIDPKKIAKYDEAVKYLTAYASNQAGSIGPRTDSGLATALTANASTSISNLAAQDVVKANVALERMKQAQASVFQAAGGQPGEFSDWSVDWNKNVDPRAFAVDLMDKTAREALLNSLKGEEKKRFLESVRIAMGAKLIDPAAFSGGGGGGK